MSGEDKGAERILRELRLPEKLASMVTGDTPDELTESARTLARELRIEPAPAEHVLLVRKALAHAERMRDLHRAEPDAPADEEAEGPPDFDGGVREPVVREDPEADHREIILQLAAEDRARRGGW